MPLVRKHAKLNVNNLSPAANAIRTKLRGCYLTIDEMKVILPQYSLGTLREAIGELKHRKQIRVSHWSLTGKLVGRRKVYAGNRQPRY